MGVEYKRDAVVKGAVVKVNGPADTTIRIYIRDRDTGLLVDRTTVMQGLEQADRRGLEEQLVKAIGKAAAEGKPYLKTSTSKGLYAMRESLPPDLRGTGRNEIQAMAQILIERGDIVQARPTGSGTPVLDVPGGDFALGIGTLERGALDTVEPDKDAEPD
jgi:hypothetical protein